MSISTNYSTLARVVSHIQNPNLPSGTLIEEIPSDIGRSWEGYKRGGILEGAEKLRKELMAAAVWLLGIPAFKWAGDKICEKLLKVPMNVDFCKAEEGNNAIRDSVNYLLTGFGKKGMDTSELAKKYGDKYRILKPSKTKPKNLKLSTKYAGKRFTLSKNSNIAQQAESMIKKIRAAKKVTSITAVVLNCLAMGVILPKINQKITSNKLKEMKQNEKAAQPKQLSRFESFEEFKNSTKSSQNDTLFSFKGRVPTSLSDLTYNVENDNVFRLIITDIPMIIGRILTSRNKFEALEYLIMDGSGIYLYNFAAKHVQNIIRKYLPNPDVNPLVAEEISRQTPELVEKAIQQVKAGVKKTGEIFQDESIAKTIYSHGTYGKYGKINRFVKNSDIDSIDKSVVEYLEYIAKKAKGVLTQENLMQIASKVNKSNATYLGIGLTASTLGLAIGIPKLTFWITKKITGRNEFTGIANYDDNKKTSSKK